MGRKANQAVIGAFVLGAVLLAVAGVVVLSGDRFFRDSQMVVAYFDGSLEGLDIGAPVTFNGVKIGSVTDLRVVIDPRDESIHTPVFFKIDARHLHDAGGGRITLKRESRRFELLIEHGLRARLELQSLVTGQLVVALNFYPTTPVRLTGRSKRYPEMPTIPSSFDTLTRRVENLPIEALVTETIGTMQSVKALVTAPEVKSALGKLDRALQAALARLTPAAGAAIEEYRALGQDARKAVANADAQILPLAASIEKAAAAADATLADARRVLGEDSPLRDELSESLREIAKAARSLRTLADYLDRHPEAVVVGKRPERQR